MSPARRTSAFLRMTIAERRAHPDRTLPLLFHKTWDWLRPYPSSLFWPPWVVWATGLLYGALMLLAVIGGIASPRRGVLFFTLAYLALTMAAHVVFIVVWRYRLACWNPVLLLYGVFGASLLLDARQPREKRGSVRDARAGPDRAECLLPARNRESNRPTDRPASAIQRRNRRRSMATADCGFALRLHRTAPLPAVKGKSRGRRALPFASLEEKSGQESASPRRDHSADLRKHAARFRLEQVSEERLRQDEARLAVGDRQWNGRGDALEAKPRVVPKSLPAPADRRVVHVDTDVAAARTEPAREVRRHRSGPASEIENEIAGAEQSETIDPVRHLARRAFEEMHGARLAPEPERRKAALFPPPSARRSPPARGATNLRSETA